ncbi:MAG: flagellar export protein FliJ [bacterium]
MRRYKFCLEAVLRYRQLIEDKLQRELAEIKRKFYLENDKLKEMEGMKRGAEEEFRKKELKKQIISEVIIHRDFLRGISSAINKQKQIIEAIARQVENKRLEVIEAMKKKKGLQRLKEKDWQGYILEVNKAELKFIDEVATNVFNRKVKID